MRALVVPEQRANDQNADSVRAASRELAFSLHPIVKIVSVDASAALESLVRSFSNSVVEDLTGFHVSQSRSTATAIVIPQRCLIKNEVRAVTTLPCQYHGFARTASTDAVPPRTVRALRS